MRKPRVYLSNDSRAHLIERYRDGWKGPQLARYFEVSVATVYYVLSQAGIARRSRSDTNTARRPAVDLPYLQELLDRRDLTVDQIAASFRVSVATLVRIMRSHDLHSQRGHGSPLAKNYFWNGGKRQEKEGYVLLKAPDHPYATTAGYVREHRLVMEAKIGRYLTRGEVVHHLDGNPRNNHPDNLELFPSNAEHLRHEWQKNWYPRAHELREAYQSRSHHPGSAIPSGSGTDVGP